MKKLGFLFSIFYFLFSGIACVPHPVSEPDPIIEGPAPEDTTFEEMVKDAINDIYGKYSYYLGDATIPVLSIWENINFKSFDYLKFFNSACPAANRIVDGDELKCDFTSDKQLRQFSIKKDGDKIKVKIDKLGEPIHFLTAKWTVEKTTNGLKVTRYEQIWNGGLYVYKIVKSEHKVAGQKKYIVADGEIGYQTWGTFIFYTDSLCFCTCQNVPDGEIYVTADDDEAKIFFLGDCSRTSAYVTINDIGGKYMYNNQDGWLLFDLGDYLKYYL